MLADLLSESVADSRGPAPVPDDAPTLGYTRLSQESDRSTTGQKKTFGRSCANHDVELVGLAAYRYAQVGDAEITADLASKIEYADPEADLEGSGQADGE
ncbi:hypothetical protein [Natronococcus sp. A-GB7]|uniref:hypothetical protein n=1 Tax=Natronococcus sp. A-GB7 TaxID=3037649 RepID=UPI00241E7351|nr:hypothetical protein [Natronococcus sp. A-GB7]MDG5821581.1 hypothetical protein [Natronococcus sp. A-GB7]